MKATIAIRPMSLASGVSATFLAKMLGALLALSVSVIVSRSLGPEGRGAFASAMTLAAVGIQFASLGLHSSNTYYVAQDRSLLASLMANSLLISAVAGVTAALLIALVIQITTLLNGVDGILIGLALVWIPIGLAYMLLQNLLLGTMSVMRFNLIEIFVKSLNLLLAVALFFLGIGNEHSYLAAGLISLVVAALITWKSLAPSSGAVASVSLVLLQRQLPFAFRSYLASLFAFMLLRSDLLMVQHFAGNAEAGQYSIAVSMADMLGLLPASASALLFPKLSGITDRSTRRRTTWKMIFHIAWIMLLMGLVAGVIAGPVVSLLFGNAFLPAVPMFRILVGAIVIYGVNNILANLLAAEGLPWSGVWIWTIALVLNMTLNWFWIPMYGGEGAAYASLIAYAVAFVLQIRIALISRESK